MTSMVVLPAPPPTIPTPLPPRPVDPTPIPEDEGGSGGGVSPGPVTPVVKKTTNGSTKTETKYRTTKVQETVVHTVTDNGTGGFGDNGTVNYAGKSLNLRLVTLDSSTDGYKSDYEDSSAFDDPSPDGTASNSSTKGGEYLDNTVSEQVLATSTLSVTYSTGFASEIANTSSYTPPAVTIDLCPYTSDYVVPGSVRFTWMGRVFEDYDGVLIRDRTAQSDGFVAGQMNYATGIATVTDYVVDGPATKFTLDSLWTVRQNWNTASVFGRTQAAPVKPTGFVMNLVDSQGNNITATGDLNGNLTGPHLRGNIEYLTGIFELQFGDYVLDSSLTPEQKLEWWYSADDVGAVQPDKIWRPWPVDPTTLRYNTVSYFYLPLDADILGVDPVRLPQDGRVPIFRPGGFAVVGHTGSVTATVTNGQTIDCARTRLSRVRLVGSDGVTIQNGYTTNLDAGTVTFTDVTGYAQPVTIQHRIEDMAMVRDVQITGEIAFTRALSHDFPLGSFISSALVSGDLKARVSALFDVSTWNGTLWEDTPSVTPATGTYNDVLAPIEVTNAGASTERFALQFTSTSGFRVVGEHVGVIAEGTINADCAPINPATGQPYFTIRAIGWGTGWAVGNALRINTVGALFPVWVVRTIQQGAETVRDDKFTLIARGDVDRPPSTP